MNDVVYGSIAELLSLAGSAVAAALFTVGGVLMEHAGFQDALAGQFGIGAWEIVVGGLLLFVGLYLLGYQKVWTGIRERATQ